MRRMHPPQGQVRRPPAVRELLVLQSPRRLRVPPALAQKRRQQKVRGAARVPRPETADGLGPANQDAPQARLTRPRSSCALSRASSRPSFQVLM